MNLSALLEMLDALKTAAGEKFFGRMLAMMLYELNDAEAMSVVRTGPHSRSTPAPGNTTAPATISTSPG